MELTAFPQKIVFIASDHAGFALKNALTAYLTPLGWQVQDIGTHSKTSCDYPDFANALCLAMQDSGNPGILVCGTGIGMSMAANRHKHIRAAVCTHEFHAEACRLHNNANVICLGERVTAEGLACRLVHLFLTTPFEGGRHTRRLEGML